MKNKIPNFRSEAEERTYWASHDSADRIDWKQAKRVVFSNLRPSVKSISLRLPESLLEGLRLLANKRDVPYQSLLKIFLSERIEHELKLRPNQWATHSKVADKPSTRPYSAKRSRKSGKR